MASLDAVVGSSRLSGAISVNTIYYVAGLLESFAGLRRALAPGGRLVLGLGDPAYMAALPFADSLILRQVDEVIEILAAVGFTTTDHIRTSEDPRSFHLVGCTAGGTDDESDAG